MSEAKIDEFPCIFPASREIGLQRRVRSRLPPPAESQVRTSLSREFVFLGREAAVFRGCPGPDERPGSAETRGAREHLAERRRYLCRAIFQYRTAGDEAGDDAADLIAGPRVVDRRQVARNISRKL